MPPRGRAETITRGRSFPGELREECLRRDRACVINGESNLRLIEACNIIPHAAFGHEFTLFPERVRDVLQSIGGIDSIGNLILLDKNLHAGFGERHMQWAIHVDEQANRDLHRVFRTVATHDGPVGFANQVKLPDDKQSGPDTARDLWPDLTLLRFRL
uniref:HNH nuclease domain-containing protein n=1 Tax=Spongospora subterranea TaxID=70186 RepID=A0A0H5RD93_9EUKA|eukprot:CRZ11716.1 hypothetical protein [Spongospora subterranea]